MEIAGELRVATATAIEKGTLADADRAFDTLQAHLDAHSLGGSEDLALRLGSRHAEAWELDTIATRTAHHFESIKTGSGCSRVNAVTRWRDPAALAALAGSLARARELFRRGCDHWRAVDASTWLGDLEGVEADLVAAHRPRCKQRTSPSPSTYRAQHAIGLALARGEPAVGKRMAQAALGRAKGYPGASIDACRARVILGYFAEQELAFSLAREHYKQAGAQRTDAHGWTGPEGADPCYATAAARLASLATARDQWALPRTTLFGSVTAPPATTVRVAFQAHPPVPPGVTPDPFGLGGDPDLRHPWPERSVFWIEAEIEDGRLLARLPPGDWLPQVELEPAGRWRLADDICFESVRVTGKRGEVLPELPALRFVERT